MRQVAVHIGIQAPEMQQQDGTQHALGAACSMHKSEKLCADPGLDLQSQLQKTGSRHSAQGAYWIAVGRPGRDRQSHLQEAGSYHSVQIAHWTYTDSVARHRSSRQ